MSAPYILVEVNNPSTVRHIIRAFAGKARFYQMRPHPPVPGCIQNWRGGVDNAAVLTDSACLGDDNCINVSALTPEDVTAALLTAIYTTPDNVGLSNEQPSTGDSSGPSVTQMAKNFGAAMVDFAGSGFQKASKEEHAARMDICNKCEFWDAQARFGLGKCQKCGCTGAKQWIASSTCPIGLWGSVAKISARATTDTEFQERLDVCKQCEFWSSKDGSEVGKCLKCGCSTKYKLRKSDEACPIGKWSAIA